MQSRPVAVSLGLLLLVVGLVTPASAHQIVIGRPVTEPAALALLGSGMFGLVGLCRRRRTRVAHKAALHPTAEPTDFASHTSHVSAPALQSAST
jgi:PEP-CTERM motif